MRGEKTPLFERCEMIRNRNEHSLFMDFSKMENEKHHQPSDIDMFYIGKNNTLILGEIKNERGIFSDGQKRLYEKVAKGWRYESLILFITHNKYVQKGDTEVDVANCFVKEYFYKGQWREPKLPTRVYEFIDKFA